MMPKRDLIFKNAELDRCLRPACEKVLEHFQVPDTRLLCFLDAEDMRISGDSS